MTSSTLRELRLAAGLTQEELARRAGVSRQLVGAVETGRHLPRVDAALAIAAALQVEVGAIFPGDTTARDIVSGFAPAEGSPVRIGWVGEVQVTAPARLGGEGWDVADGYVRRGRVEEGRRSHPGVVVAGCEPALEVLERLLREEGRGAVAASTSSLLARRGLAEGRAHAAVVHGPRRARSGPEAACFRLASWQVGLAGPPDAGSGWWRAALAGRGPVVQREPDASVQRAYVSVAGDDVPGPRVKTHLEAARRAVSTGMPAVTIEPAAVALGARFHPLETHLAELWVAAPWLEERPVAEALDLIDSRRFRRRLEAVGGYDLDGIGTRLG